MEDQQPSPRSFTRFQDSHTSKLFPSLASMTLITVLSLDFGGKYGSSVCPRSSPRVYAVEFDITITFGYNDTGIYRQPADVKFARARPLNGSDEQRNLISATATSRKIGSICREARDATVFTLPDVIEMRANPKEWPGTSQRPHVLAGSFRFNAKRDVIAVVFSSIEGLRFILKWIRQGNSLPCARSIQNVALDTGFIEDVQITGVWTKCDCGRSDCAICAADPLPDFLRLFPSLRTFHILQYSTQFMPESVGYASEYVGPVDQCKCDNEVQGIKHDWPLFKGMAANEWFISYTEDGGCLYPTLPRLACDRRRHRVRCMWPYYDALREVDIRILRRVTLVGT